MTHKGTRGGAAGLSSLIRHLPRTAQASNRHESIENGAPLTVLIACFLAVRLLPAFNADHAQKLCCSYFSLGLDRAAGGGGTSGGNPRRARV